MAEKNKDARKYVNYKINYMAENKKAKTQGSSKGKDKATSGGGKDTNTGGAPSKQNKSGGKGTTTGSKGTSGS
jgi:hypothetical protein